MLTLLAFLSLFLALILVVAVAINNSRFKRSHTKGMNFIEAQLTLFNAPFNGAPFKKEDLSEESWALLKRVRVLSAIFLANMAFFVMIVFLKNS